jgi:hypothetical protein
MFPIRKLLHIGRVEGAAPRNEVTPLPNLILFNYERNEFISGGG